MHLGEDNEKNQQILQERMDSAKDAIEKVCLTCLKRGAKTIKGLGRSFRLMDKDRSMDLSFDEFKNGLERYGLQLDENIVQEVFQKFDTDGSGKINIDEFELAIRGSMNSRRLAAVDKAFAKMDNTGDGVITIEDMRKMYDVSQHPKYKKGDWTADECFKKYLENFDPLYAEDEKVEKDEFVSYYTSVSASIDSDDYFVEMMTKTWNL